MLIVLTIAWFLAVMVFLAALYRAVFAFAYLLLPAPSRKASADGTLRRFLVLIPAHNEELLIDDVLETIRAADYPQDLIEIHVIADNCSDGTATKVRSRGEHAEERSDPNNPGKGQAIDWVLGRLDLAAFDAIALFDADNLVDSQFFAAMNRELEAGRNCLQGYYGIANPDDSTMTRLLAVTYVMKNLLFNTGKAKLGLSVILMGTGMVFRSSVLARTGWQAMSIGEDLEQTFCLLDHDERIHFVPDALARAQEATTLEQGYTQRQRWATGRRALNAVARRAIVDGLRRRSLHRIDTGLDILMPTYSKLANWSIVAFAVTATLAITTRATGGMTLGTAASTPLALVGLALAYQAFEGVTALRLMKAESHFIASLAFAPVYLAWKGVIDLLALIGHRRNDWTRTERQPHSEGGAERDAKEGAQATRSSGVQDPKTDPS